MTTALTRQQQDELRSCEKIISRGIDTFREVGAALAKIRDDKLYRAEYKTFESYCNTRWGFGRSYAARLIQAADVPEVLPNGNKIETEGQARKYLQEQRKPRGEHRPLCSVCEVRPRAAGQDRCQFCIDVNRQPYGEIGTDGVFRKAADRKAAPVDLDRLCPVCEVRDCVVGQDRCQKCLDEPDDELSDSTVTWSGKPVAKKTLGIYREFHSRVGLTWGGAEVTAKREKVSLELPDDHPIAVALGHLWEAYAELDEAIKAEQDR